MEMIETQLSQLNNNQKQFIDKQTKVGCMKSKIQKEFYANHDSELTDKKKDIEPD